MHPFSRLKLTTAFSLFLIFMIGLALISSTRLATHADDTIPKHFSPNDCGNWSVVPNSTPNSTYTSLFGVTALSTSDAWAVGEYFGSSAYQTLTLHWDGTQWTVIPSPNVGTNYSYLYAVAAISTSDVWAVGTYTDSTTYTSYPLIEHWNGSQWSIFPNPAVSSNTQLSAIAVVSANDIWAVGSEKGATLTEHWDGIQWTIIPSPTPLASGSLSSVAVISTNDIWAVGTGEQAQGLQTFSLHWNGSQWNTVNTINPINPYAADKLYGVSATGTKDVWAVGNKGRHTLIEHWNGRKWSVTTSPNALHNNELFSVVALSPQNVWAIGYSGQTPSTGRTYTLIEHWDGIQWSIINGPNTGATYSYLNHIASVPGTSQMWAVGSNNIRQSLIEFYC